MQNTDSPAVVQTAQEKGAIGFGWDSDMSKFGGKAHLAASILNWGVIYNKVVADVEAGTWKNEPIWWGVKEGAVNIDNFAADLPADVKKLAEERRDGIKSGKLHPFSGPIKDQAGTLRIKAGERASHDMLWGMDWFVEGVDATLPK